MSTNTHYRPTLPVLISLSGLLLLLLVLLTQAILLHLSLEATLPHLSLVATRQLQPLVETPRLLLQTLPTITSSLEVVPPVSLPQKGLRRAVLLFC
jgi:hypothetical protein